LRRAPEFTLPRERQWSWWAVLASLLAHAAILSVRATDWFWSEGTPSEVMYIPIEPGMAAVDMIYREATPRRRPTPRPPDEVEAPVSSGGPAPAEELVAGEPGGLPEAPVDTAAGPPTPEGTGRRTVPRLRPSFGEGKLWVRPLPLPPGELAQRLSRSHYELVDSAVSEIVQMYIDSILRTPVPFDTKPPSWTTTIGGKTFGIDSRNIYLGGLKIPTAILALLPIPQVSNIDLRSAQRTRDMQADLQYAAQRAQTMEDFKRAIRQLREQRAAELEFERNQRRTPADTTKVP
jgi:hypothetical protein